MEEKDKIAELFKEGLGNYKAPVDGSLWSGVQSGLKMGSANTGSTLGSKFSSIASASGTKMLTAIVSIGIVGLTIGGYYLFNGKAEESSEQKKTLHNEQPATIKEENENSIQSDHAVEQIQQLGKKEDLVTSDEVEEQSPANKEKGVSESPLVNAEDQTAEEPEKIIEETQEELENNASTSTDEHVLSEGIDMNTETTLQTEAHSVVEKEQESLGKSKIEESSAESTIAKDAPTEAPAQEEEIHIVIPNIFTPNQDGVNDIFIIEDDALEHLEVSVFNKSGNLIHQWSGIYGYWDGRLPNGSDARNDTYIYQVSGQKNGKPFIKKGIITLKR